MPIKPFKPPGPEPSQATRIYNKFTTLDNRFATSTILRALAYTLTEFSLDATDGAILLGLQDFESDQVYCSDQQLEKLLDLLSTCETY